MPQDEVSRALQDGARYVAMASNPQLSSLERTRAHFYAVATIFDVFQLWSQSLRALADDMEIDRRQRPT